jgi:hypothetical protein
MFYEINIVESRITQNTVYAKRTPERKNRLCKEVAAVVSRMRIARAVPEIDNISFAEESYQWMM